MNKANKRETTETNVPRELRNQLTTAFGGLFCLQGGRIGGGAFISQRFTLEWSFCTSEKANENKTIHRFKRYPLCVGEL